MPILYHVYSVFLSVLMNNSLFFSCQYGGYVCNNTVWHFINTYACHICYFIMNIWNKEIKNHQFYFRIKHQVENSHFSVHVQCTLKGDFVPPSIQNVPCLPHSWTILEHDNLWKCNRSLVGFTFFINMSHGKQKNPTSVSWFVSWDTNTTCVTCSHLVH